MYEWKLKATEIVLANENITDVKQINFQKISKELKYISTQDILRYFRMVSVRKGRLKNNPKRHRNINEKSFRESLVDGKNYLMMLQEKNRGQSKFDRAEYTKLIRFYDTLKKCPQNIFER